VAAGALVPYLRRRFDGCFDGALMAAGALTAAVVPVCVGTSSATTQPQLYADLPPLPFPLELVALCMLRTITRRDHVGKLDAREHVSFSSSVGCGCNFYVNVFFTCCAPSHGREAPSPGETMQGSWMHVSMGPV